MVLFGCVVVVMLLSLVVARFSRSVQRIQEISDRAYKLKFAQQTYQSILRLRSSTLAPQPFNLARRAVLLLYWALRVGQMGVAGSSSGSSSRVVATSRVSAAAPQDPPPSSPSSADGRGGGGEGRAGSGDLGGQRDSRLLSGAQAEWRPSTIPKGVGSARDLAAARAAAAGDKEVRVLASYDAAGSTEATASEVTASSSARSQM